MCQVVCKVAIHISVEKYKLPFRCFCFMIAIKEVFFKMPTTLGIWL